MSYFWGGVHPAADTEPDVERERPDVAGGGRFAPLARFRKRLSTQRRSDGCRRCGPEGAERPGRPPVGVFEVVESAPGCSHRDRR